MILIMTIMVGSDGGKGNLLKVALGNDYMQVILCAICNERE